MGYHFGLVGHNISYSVSPRIFELIFGSEGIEGKYSVFDVSPDQFPSETRKLKELDGFSVTIPYKERIIPYLTGLSDDARMIGAVNSVRVEDGIFYGYNADALGFIYPLKAINGDFKRVLILGHGGSARAVLYALVREYPGVAVDIRGRDINRVLAFVKSVKGFESEGIRITPKTYADLRDNDKYNLVVNCTPLGSADSLEKSPLPESFRFDGCSVCYDLVYKPAKTRFLDWAEKNGCRIINGLPMLVRQALESYIIWTGRRIDTDSLTGYILESLAEIGKY
jgi:shikimate dehydrogenase